MQYRATATVVV